MRKLGENEMKPNCRMPQNVRLSEWLGPSARTMKLLGRELALLRLMLVFQGLAEWALEWRVRGKEPHSCPLAPSRPD